MAATIGRLTGKVGVCLSTLGPGATNFVTAAAACVVDHDTDIAEAVERNMMRSCARQSSGSPDDSRFIQKSMPRSHCSASRSPQNQIAAGSPEVWRHQLH